MRAFWDRMMQVNARAVLGVLVPLCLLWIVIGTVLVGRTPTGNALQSVEPLKLNWLPDALGDEHTVLPPERPDAPSLFTSGFLVEEINARKEAAALREQKKREREETRSETGVAVAAAVPVPAIPPVEEPVLPPIPVQYLGMMQKGDGRAVALIKVGNPSVVLKLSPGERTELMEVISIEGRLVNLRVKDEPVVLERGKTIELEPVP